MEANTEAGEDQAWWAWQTMTRELASGAVVDREPRCWGCHKKLAVFLTRPWRIDCARCGTANAGGVETPALAR